MLDGKTENDSSPEDNCIIRMQDRCELGCLKIARLCRIEDLVLSAVVSEENTLVDFEDVTTLKLRKETQQLLKVTRCLSLYFLGLSLIYLIQTSICYFSLTQESFDRYFSQEEYAIEMYGLVSTVCLINIIHALTMISLAAFLILFTRRFRILDEKHYAQLTLLTMIITIIYFLPVLIVAYKAWSDANQATKTNHRGAVGRFFDMVFYVLMRSAMGRGGFILTLIIQFQLYGLTFAMMWCASYVKDISQKIRQLKENQAGTYEGLELRGVEDATKSSVNENGGDDKSINDDGPENNILIDENYSIQEDTSQLIYDHQP